MLLERRAPLVAPWLGLALGLAIARDARASGPWSDPSLPPSSRARLLVAAMTQDEKLAMVHGVAGRAQPLASTIEDGRAYSFASAVDSPLAQGAVTLGSCLDVPGAGADPGLVLQAAGCFGNGGQVYGAARVASGAFALVNAGANLCLGAIGGAAAGSRIELFACDSTSASQGFAFTTLSAGVAIVHVASGRCVEVAGSSLAGAPVVLADCDAQSAAQRWLPYEGLDVGVVVGNARLGIPALRLEDGPAGVGEAIGGVTQFPAPLLVAATFDVDVANAYGASIAAEHVIKGDDVVLGPMVNVLRVPRDGRAFEGLGEDPLLASRMVAAITRGMQGQGVVATVKHFIDNDQETSRFDTNAVIDARTQHEIALPPFRAAVEAGVGAVMCAYNLVDGVYSCESDALLNRLLKRELAFTGFVMSDWGATHSTAAAALAGLDMEMPDSRFFGEALASAVARGDVPAARLDDMVGRIATSMFQAGLFDRAPSGSLGATATSPAHRAFARSVAAQGTVLLKNDRATLPLDAARVRSLAVIGDAADLAPISAGGGSGFVRAAHVTSPLEGLRARAGATPVTYAASGADVASVAAAADAAIVVLAVTSGEGADRPSLDLPAGSEAMVRAAVAANPRTVVVVYAPAQVTMPWAEVAPAILFGFLPGEAEGDALADVVFGDVSPSGKLPMTIAATERDYPASSPAQFPGVDRGPAPDGEEAYEARYTEGLLVGYRHFDAAGIAPLFPFGHGLSYATFAYANLVVAPTTLGATGTVNVSFDVTNTGAVAGAEVAQVYLGLPAFTSEPPWQLAAFQKVQLAPGASAHVTLALPPERYSFWSAGLGAWVPYPAMHRVVVGGSPRDARLAGSFAIAGGPLAGVEQPAEDAALAGGAVVATDHGGYTGSGFVSGLDAPGARAVLTVHADVAGPRRLTLRYAATSDATLSVYVAGSKIGRLAFARGASFDTWDFATQTVDLPAGDVEITLAHDADDDGLALLDALLVGDPGDLVDAGPGASMGRVASVGGSGCACAGVSSRGASFAWCIALASGLLFARRRRRSSRSRA